MPDEPVTPPPKRQNSLFGVRAQVKDCAERVACFGTGFSYAAKKKRIQCTRSLDSRTRMRASK